MITGATAPGGEGRDDGGMPRVLLIVPNATYRAEDFLDAASRLGVEVVTGSEPDPALGGLLGDRFLPLELADPERAAQAIAAFDARVPLDAIVAVDDGGGLVAACAAQRLRLRHNPPEAVARTRNKAAMRASLATAEVPQPAFAVLDAPTPARAARAAAAIGFPAVVKPVSLCASRGVIRVDDEPGARAAAARIRAILDEAGAPPGEPLLVEAFVPGAEIAVEGLVRAGELEVLAIFDKPDPLDGPFFEETIYVTPSRAPRAHLDAALDATRRAVGALGIVDGPIHAELRLGGPPAGPQVIEVAARTIGGRCARTLRFATGASLEELVLAHALGRDELVGARGAPGAAGVMMLPVPASGRLVRVDGVERACAVPGVTGCEVTVPIGSRVRQAPETDRYLGFLFARGADPGAVEAALRAGHRELEIEIEIEIEIAPEG